MVDKVGAKAFWTFVITSIALVMVTLDNLVVTTATPVIRKDLHASLQSLEWTVNAYTLTFAVLLLTGAALGDRLGRRLMFAVGLGIFTAGSAAAALSTSATALDLSRAVQGVGGAIVTPLTLTILSAAVPRERRGPPPRLWGRHGGRRRPAPPPPVRPRGHGPAPAPGLLGQRRPPARPRPPRPPPPART